MKGFFQVKTVEKAKTMLFDAWKPRILERERIPLSHALGRIVAKSVASTEDIPPFPRSTMDGYAVRARDTFGASESLPALLGIIGEVHMGQPPQESLSDGQAAKIPTGGFFPEGSDACVMIEHTLSPDEATLLVERPVYPGENMIHKGEDIYRGQVVLKAGRILRPFEIGALAALGQSTVEVLVRPKVAIISTGDEIVPIDEIPGPGEIRDINTHSLSALTIDSGALPVVLGIAGDEYEKVHDKVVQGLSEADLVVVSGGSSVGARDVVVKVLEDLGPPGVLAHGVSIKPGKPVIIAICDGKPVFGLPGHPVSALTTFGIFVTSAIRHLLWHSLERCGDEKDCSSAPQLGYLQKPPLFVDATLSRNLSSSPGRQDFVRVRLREVEGKLFADPVLGKSGLISTMVHSDGEISIPANWEGLKKGALVKVRIS